MVTAERERAERERVDREAREAQEAERTRLAKIAQERADREAAERTRLAHQQADQQAARERQESERARLAKVEQERAQRAAEARQEAERTQLAMMERERLERERQKAEAARAGPGREAGLQVIPTSVPQQQACQQDEETLTRLRANQSRDEVIRFEKELTCERLRPQVLRLRESLGIEGDEQAKGSPRPAPAAPAAKQEQAAVKVDPRMQAQACQRDEEKLERLRTSRVRGDIIRFERELGCEKLRLQVIRLKESLGD
jgi:hypothetical protein